MGSVLYVAVWETLGVFRSPRNPPSEDIKDINKIWGGFLGAP